MVTGTDTGVGKTVVTAAVAAALRARGIDVRAIKPVESGVTPGANTDALLLGLAAGHPPLCFRSFAEPLSPHLAAERAGVIVSPAELLAWVLAERSAMTLVEGAGGWSVPLCRDEDRLFTLADLAVALSAGVVLVARNRLGVLNHTALTVDAIRARGLVVARLVVTPGEAGLAESLNVAELSRMFPGIPVVEIGVADPASVASLVRAGEAVIGSPSGWLLTP